MTELYNKDVKVLIDKLNDVIIELRSSQSSRLHVGLLTFDSRRLEEELLHISTHAKVLTPVDYPETHPTILLETA